jgi:transcriptional regulator of NAD metabolism
VMNELKMLRETNFNLEDDETQEVLKKWRKISRNNGSLLISCLYCSDLACNSFIVFFPS